MTPRKPQLQTPCGGDSACPRGEEGRGLGASPAASAPKALLLARGSSRAPPAGGRRLEDLGPFPFVFTAPVPLIEIPLTRPRASPQCSCPSFEGGCCQDPEVRAWPSGAALPTPAVLDGFLWPWPVSVRGWDPGARRAGGALALGRGGARCARASAGPSGARAAFGKVRAGGGKNREASCVLRPRWLPCLRSGLRSRSLSLGLLRSPCHLPCGIQGPGLGDCNQTAGTWSQCCDTRKATARAWSRVALPKGHLPHPARSKVWFASALMELYAACWLQWGAQLPGGLCLEQSPSQATYHRPGEGKGELSGVWGLDFGGREVARPLPHLILPLEGRWQEFPPPGGWEHMQQGLVHATCP